MKIIFDARHLTMYPVGKPGFYGGTELMVRELASRLARNHTVHVVTPDLDTEEQRGETEWWWSPRVHPDTADVVVCVSGLEYAAEYAADYLVFATNGVDPDLGPGNSFASAVDAFPVFSNKHAELMRNFRPSIPEEKCYVTGLGIDLDVYRPVKPDPIYDIEKVTGRLFYANDPARGLWHMLDIFDCLKKEVPEASLHISYDFERQFNNIAYAANTLAEEMWECKRRIASTEGVTSLGALSRSDVAREQLECQVHAMPSDPPNVGSQIHGITQMECAAAGCALVLSETEAFPEVFSSAALMLPLPGTYMPHLMRRFDAQDWADNIAPIMRNEDNRLEEMSHRARELAAKHTWDAVAENWEDMLGKLATQAAVSQASNSPIGVA